MGPVADEFPEVHAQVPGIRNPLGEWRRPLTMGVLDDRIRVQRRRSELGQPCARRPGCRRQRLSPDKCGKRVNFRFPFTRPPLRSRQMDGRVRETKKRRAPLRRRRLVGSWAFGRRDTVGPPECLTAPASAGSAERARPDLPGRRPALPDRPPPFAVSGFSIFAVERISNNSCLSLASSEY